MLTGAMLMAVILSAGAWCRKKIGRTGRGATLLLLAAVAACAAWPGAKARAEAASERPFYGWAAPGPGERPIPIYQCGLAATMYTLQYFGHTYRSEDLIALMVPSAQGISLADMMRAMQVHGLEVDPRAGVRAGDLLASLADDRIAILPTTATAGEKGHFYVIVRGRGSSFLLVDAGRSVKAQSVPEMQERLRANQGVVAFVSVRQQGQDARAVGIDPEEANLGEIHSTDAQATAKFTIRNGSARCVFVTHVAPACSCTASGWKGGLLSPGQEVAIDISIKPTALRVGKFKKSVAFTFADGSSQEVYMAGECLGPEESQGIRVAPTEVYFDFGETPRHQTKQLKVFGRGPVRVALNEADWASAEVIRQPTNQPGTIEVTADPNRTTSTRDAGVLQVWVVDGEPRLSIPIHAVRSKPYQVEGRIVTLARDKGPQAGAFVFRKGTANVGAIQVEPVAGGLDGIQLQPVQNEQESRLQVNVTGAGPLASGLHPIDLLIRVGDAGGRPYSERVYIMVR